jgi:anthranilate synthase component 2/para-aminobenzoate synthetase component 2
MKFIVIDHQDSFTYNLVHLLSRESEVEVLEYGPSILHHRDWGSSHLVFSPGPGSPADYSFSIDLYQQMKGKLKILGVCLGFQMIVYAEGGSVVRQNRVMHGVETPLTVVNNAPMYQGLEDIRVGRYHSLQVDSSRFPSDLMVTGLDVENDVILSFKHQHLPIYGLQFHPESFLTNLGERIIGNIF